MKLLGRLQRAALGRYGDGPAGRPAGTPDPDAGLALDFETVAPGVPGPYSSTDDALPPSEPARSGSVRDMASSPPPETGRGGRERTDAGSAAATEPGPPRGPEDPGPLHRPVAPTAAVKGDAPPGWQFTVPPGEDQPPSGPLAPAAMAARAGAQFKAAPPDTPSGPLAMAARAGAQLKALPLDTSSDAAASERRAAGGLDPLTAWTAANAPVATPTVAKPSSRKDPKPELPTLYIGRIDIRISPPPKPDPKPEPAKTMAETRSARHGSTTSIRSQLRRAGLRRL